VRGSFKTGSFGIVFSLAADWLSKVRDMFLSENATAAATAFTILTSLGLVASKTRRGFISVIKWLRGRRIERIEQIGDMFCICMVHVRQWQTTSGAHTEYDVIEVLEHRQAARQLPLPIDT